MVIVISNGIYRVLASIYVVQNKSLSDEALFWRAHVAT
jgi:hypothetical protein